MDFSRGGEGAAAEAWSVPGRVAFEPVSLPCLGSPLLPLLNKAGRFHNSNTLLHAA